MPFSIDPPVACNCNFDGGHEPHCAIVAAHDARFFKNNVDKKEPKEESDATMNHFDAFLTGVKESALIVRTGKNTHGHHFSDEGRLNHAVWIGQHIGPVLSELDRLRGENDEAHYVMRAILTDLPVSRNWLNPAIETQLAKMVACYRLQTEDKASSEANKVEEPSVSGTVTGRSIPAFPTVEQCLAVIAAKMEKPINLAALGLLAQADALGIRRLG